MPLFLLEMNKKVGSPDRHEQLCVAIMVVRLRIKLSLRAAEWDGTYPVINGIVEFPIVPCLTPLYSQLLMASCVR